MKHFLYLAAALLLTTACTQEAPTYKEGQALLFQVSDGGYTGTTPSAEARATENGYATEFAAGDACGMYMVRDGKVAYANVKLTATTDGASGDIVWQPETSLTGTGGGETYYLYYPYQADMDGQTAAPPAPTKRQKVSSSRSLPAGNPLPTKAQQPHTPHRT